MSNIENAIAMVTEAVEAVFAAGGGLDDVLEGVRGAGVAGAEFMAVALPNDPPEGFVRCRIPVFTKASGAWMVEEWSDQHVRIYGDWPLSERLSWVTFDAPKPQPPAEVVGTVEVGDE